jgi:hypothetical protein
MSSTDAAAAFPYAVHLDIKFDALDLIDVSSLVQACTDQWYNQTLCKVNDSAVRLGVMQGEYHWHKHDNDDARAYGPPSGSAATPIGLPWRLGWTALGIVGSDTDWRGAWAPR